ncbi:MAG: DeoR/GlpR family DNA-binding transcription regulator [Kiloniellales bacterium]
MSDLTRSPLLRRRALERELAIRGAASVAELCHLLGASPATIRRDLAALEDEGAIKRGYGGASARSVRPAEEALAVREQKHVDAKRAIARVAVRLIGAGDTVFLNDGSSILAVARELAASDIEAFVATPAVNLPSILVANPAISICLLGGFIRPTSLATGGPFAERMVEQINADLAILSCDAFNATDGMCFMNAEDAALARKMTTKAKRRVALVHSAKFAWRARISAVPLADLDVLVTESLPPEVNGELQRAEVEVVLAGSDVGAAGPDFLSAGSAA